MSTQPVKKQGYMIKSSKNSINSYFQPVKAPQDIVDRPKIVIKDYLKSSHFKNSQFAPSSHKTSAGPFDLHKSGSTDKLSNGLASMHVDSQTRKPPPRDLTTTSEAIEVTDSDSDDQEIEPTRILRKRKAKSAPIIFETDSGEEEEELSIPNRRKKSKRIIEDDDDEMENAEEEEEPSVQEIESSDDNDEAYREDDIMIDRILKLYPNRSAAETRKAIKRTGSAYLVVNEYMEDEKRQYPDRGYKKLKSDDDIQRMALEKLKGLQRDRLILRFFNSASSQDIQDITGCKPNIAELIIEDLRPFDDLMDLEVKLRQTKGTSLRFINSCREMMNGYTAVDQIIESIEHEGSKLKSILDLWRGFTSTGKNTPAASDDDEPDEKAGTHLMHVDENVDKKSPIYKDAMKGFLFEQPECVNEEMTLKDYQLLGVNWMLLLYRKGISGILADEMGLGKTAQVITFLGRLKEIGQEGPHLIIVPSSTVENWLREISRFCPSLVVRLYHGSVKERAEQRYELREDKGDYQIVVTTYNVATSNADDRSFLKKMKFRSMILDEGHMIKNCTSERYKYLMKISVPFRLLLTGTPLQNNLQELVSLLIFIMPETFAAHEEEVRSIFKIRTGSTKEEQDGPKGAENAVQVLSRDRIQRAKKMMTPFVLRRKKEDVLKDLPSKRHVVESCTMTPNQKKIYFDIIRKSKKSLEEKDATVKKSAMDAQYESMSNIIMHLRKAADHPLLFRNIYTDDLLRQMTTEIMKEVQYWDANKEYVYEDMCIMTDFELNNLCKEHKVNQWFK